MKDVSFFVMLGAAVLAGVIVAAMSGVSASVPVAAFVGVLVVTGTVQRIRKRRT